MKWKTDIVKFENITVEDVKFLFSQAEKKLDDTIKVSEAITTRSYTIITLLVGILSATTAILLKSLIDNGVKNYQSVLIITAIVYLIICLLFLIWNISATKYWTLGSEPQYLCRNIFFTDEIPKELRTVYLYMNEIEFYQERIEINLEKNRTRFVMLRNVIRAMFSLPFFILIVFL